MKVDAKALKSIFLRAIELNSEVERRAYLDRTCEAGTALRDEVDRLLRAYRPDDPLLEPSTQVESEALAATVRNNRHASVATPTSAGTWIDGRYQLLELLGEGGMGSVWKAQQSAPVQRQVAIKLVKAGMVSRQILERFERERQALSRLDHPQIARVLDGGTSETGIPYFVMELVEGIPLKAFCQQQRLTLNERLELFRDICRAVHHAHQKGVIHRDLKPNNILAALRENRPVVKIIDFGLAKTLASAQEHLQSLENTTVGTFIGTPIYMAPERFGSQAADADIRDDVYSLGVMLYELLTTTTPIEAQQFHGVSWDELVRRIRESESSPPSARLQSLERQALGNQAIIGDRLPTTSRMVRGELDWITLKAIDKDRARRYDSADALADDVQRFLSGEPVIAAPPSRTYRLKKVIRKHRAAAIWLSLLLAVLAAATALSTSAMISAERQKVAAQTAKSQTELELTRAQEVKRLISQMLEGVSPRRAQGADITLLKGILDDTAARLTQDEVQDDRIRAEMHRLVGDVYRQLGLYLEAEQHLTNSVALWSALLGPRDLETLDAVVKLANVHLRQGQYALAEAAFQQAHLFSVEVRGSEDPQTIGILNNLGALYFETGRYDLSEQAIREGYELRLKALGAEHRDTLASMNNLAMVHHRRGRIDLAEPLYRDALAIKTRVLGPRDPSTLAAMINLANLLADEHRNEEAESLYRDCLQRQEEVLGADHPETLMVVNNLALLYKSEGRTAEAEAMYVRAIDAKTGQLGREHPSTLQSMNNLAILYADNERWEEAETLYLETLQGRRRALKERHPDTLATMNNLAVLYEKQARWDEAEPLYLETLRIKQSVLGAGHHETELTAVNLGNLYLSMERYEDARQLYRAVIDRNGQSPRNERNLRRARSGLESALKGLGQGN